MWKSIKEVERDRTEFEEAHPLIELAHQPGDWKLADKWHLPASSLWTAVLQGRVIAAGNGLEGVLDCLEGKLGPWGTRLAGKRETQLRGAEDKIRRLEKEIAPLREELARERGKARRLRKLLEV